MQISKTLKTTALIAGCAFILSSSGCSSTSPDSATSSSSATTATTAASTLDLDNLAFDYLNAQIVAVAADNSATPVAKVAGDFPPDSSGFTTADSLVAVYNQQGVWAGKIAGERNELTQVFTPKGDPQQEDGGASIWQVNIYQGRLVVLYKTWGFPRVHDRYHLAIMDSDGTNVSEFDLQAAPVAANKAALAPDGKYYYLSTGLPATLGQLDLATGATKQIALAQNTAADAPIMVSNNRIIMSNSYYGSYATTERISSVAPDGSGYTVSAVSVNPAGLLNDGFVSLQEPQGGSEIVAYYTPYGSGPIQELPHLANPQRLSQCITPAWGKTAVQVLCRDPAGKKMSLVGTISLPR